MQPQIHDAETWRRANMLLQPIFIRLIDHLRQILERSSWQGDYTNYVIWPEGVSAQSKEHHQRLTQDLAAATDPAEHDRLQEALAQLPQPYLGYEICLRPAGLAPDAPDWGDPSHRFDLWQLCYQVCFVQYPPALTQDEVEVDEALLDEEGEVDWQQVDQKTKALVDKLFGELAGNPRPAPFSPPN